MTNTNKMREQFEEAVKRAAVEHYGYGSDNQALFDTLMERGTTGRFTVGWVNGFLLGWQASRQVVVVDLPEPHMHGSYDSPAVLFDHEVFAAIEAQGLRCEVKS